MQKLQNEQLLTKINQSPSLWRVSKTGLSWCELLPAEQRLDGGCRDAGPTAPRLLGEAALALAPARLRQRELKQQRLVETPVGKGRDNC